MSKSERDLKRAKRLVGVFGEVAILSFLSLLWSGGGNNAYY